MDDDIYDDVVAKDDLPEPTSIRDRLKRFQDANVQKPPPLTPKPKPIAPKPKVAVPSFCKPPQSDKPPDIAQKPKAPPKVTCVSGGLTEDTLKKRKELLKKALGDNQNKNEPAKPVVNKKPPPMPKSKPVDNAGSNNVGKVDISALRQRLEGQFGGRSSSSTVSGSSTGSDESAPTVERRVLENRTPFSLNRRETIDVKSVPAEENGDMDFPKPPDEAFRTSDISEEKYITDSQGRKFHEMPLPPQLDTYPPPKPQRPPGIDLPSEEDEGETYDDVSTDQPSAPTPRARPISHIPEYGSDEEIEDTKTIDGDDFYDDAASNDEIIEDNIYEAYDDVEIETVPAPVSHQPEVPPPITDKARPKVDKKKDKDLKKEQKKKEEEMKKNKKIFKMDGTEVALYVGMIQADRKGGKNELAVIKGEEVDIIRVIDNPMGKWLVRNNYGKLGYVDSSVIKGLEGPYSPPAGLIPKKAAQPPPPAGPEETYDDVDIENQDVYEALDN